MDQAIRNKLRSVVTQCRRLLEESIAQQLQGMYDIYFTGKKDGVRAEKGLLLGHLSEEERQARQDILAHFAHIKALGYKPREALEQLIREIAFTHLNRFCAYKMMEVRDVYVGGQKFREAVSRGLKSQGFLFYLAENPEQEKHYISWHQEEAYRHFLNWLGGTLSREIGVLFSPTDPANRVYPPQRVLDDVLELLNSEELKAIWTEDETIGWVYQYFTPKELRDQARKESQAPRNSYELAFRNQFFTPRYVVEFLTDNTLGRIWYEMLKGATRLKDECRYMVRRPTEVFLDDGQSSVVRCPLEDGTTDHEPPTTDEILKQAVYILHRPEKDPREIKILDPACGSGHFLLYCFDLLLVIYEEAYDIDLGTSLRVDYPTREDLHRALPGLILRHNLHGIDIDLRAVQIAGLALWLRCQRYWSEVLGPSSSAKDKKLWTRDQGLRTIRKSNVCAVPMPGEERLLTEFLKAINDARLEDLMRQVSNVPKGTKIPATRDMADSLGDLVRSVWQNMTLAGEVGSLLKVEAALQDAIASAQADWEEKLPLFRMTRHEADRPATESYVRLVPGEHEAFWGKAEGLVLIALEDYARFATGGQGLVRRLFADDAAHGFALIDLCRLRFDVVLMNPPFGGGSKPSKTYIEKAYPRTKNDLYAAFVECGLRRLLPDGLLGAITSRTGFFLTSFKQWREEILLHEAEPTVFANLGYGVLDSAMVETAAYCLVKCS